MFEWKDYGENSALFIKGINESVASLRYKDFQLIDCATSFKTKMKSDNLIDAKAEAEEYLVFRWQQVSREVERNLNAINK